MTSSRSALLRRVLAGAAVCILLPAAAFSQNNPPKDIRETRVRQQALSIPQGWPVQVRTIGSGTLYGRIGPVTDQGFVLQYVNAGKVDDRTIAFSDVKSVYHSRRAFPVSKGRIVAGVLVALIPLGVALGFAASH
jgi:hypothetical protein